MFNDRSLAWAFRALGTIALICTTVAGSGALAQQPQQVEFATFELFDGPDSVDLNPDAIRRLADMIRKAQTPGGCPLGRLKIRVAEGDLLFQQSLMIARRGALLARLHQMGVPVAGRLVVETEMFGGREGHDAVYEVPSDRTPPKLDTDSVPRKGSKVKAGDKITVTMVARDDADRWQTGIKTIQLVAESEDGRFVASENYEACAEPKEKRVVATYEVPANPPPIVRLTALAEDHAGLMDTDAAEFPTQGDWYGRIEWSIHGKEDTSRRPNENRSEFKSDGYADLTVTYDGQGNLTGTLLGSQKVETDWWGYPHGSGEVCIGSAPPTQVRARVIGSYTPGRNSLSLQLVDIEAQIIVPWSGGGPNLNCSGEKSPFDNGPPLFAVVRSLQPVGDGTYRAEITSTGPIHTSRYSMTLRPVGN